MKRLYRLGTTALMMSQAMTAAAAIATCTTGTDRDIAERFETRWQETLRAPSTTALAALYTESAVLMPPTDETLVGRAPIAAYLGTHEVPATATNYSVDIVSCERNGNELHVAGVWGLPQSGGGATTWQSGNLLRILKRDADGNWVAAYEMWN